jgi:hypothetical protein
MGGNGSSHWTNREINTRTVLMLSITDIGYRHIRKWTDNRTTVPHRVCARENTTGRCKRHVIPCSINDSLTLVRVSKARR